MKSKDSPSEYLSIPFLTLDNINSRLLNHWEKEDIIFDHRPGGKGWRKHSLKDRLWIEIVEQLREFNYSLNSIRILKECFYGTGINLQLSVLEKILNHYLSGKKSMDIHVYANGNVNLIENRFAFKDSDNYICLNVDSIIEKVLPNIIETPNTYDTVFKLTPKEEKLFKLIKSGVFKKIEVELEGGEIKQLNAEQIIKDRALFHDLAKEFPYQDIITVIRDGKPHISKRIIKLRK